MRVPTVVARLLTALVVSGVLVFHLAAEAQSGIRGARYGSAGAPGLTQAAGDGFYVNIDGDTMTGTLLVPALTLSGDFVTTTGIINSTVGTGTTGFVWNVVNARASGDLYSWKENGVQYLSMDHTGKLVVSAGFVVVAGNLDVRSALLNAGASSPCSATGAADSGLCTFDDSVLDGYPYVEEMNAPTAEIGYWGLHSVPNSNILTFTDGAGGEHIIGGVSLAGQMHQTRNTTAFVINAADDIHSYHSGTTPLVGTQLNGWIFDAGGDGTSHTIASIAQNGSDITVTTDTSHTLAIGNIVSLTNTGDANYDKIHIVTAVGGATTFDVTATFTATATGWVDEAATLTADTGAAGSYTVTWWCTASAVGANQIFDLSVYKEAELIVGTEMRRKFVSNDFGFTGGGGRVTVADGDHISFALANVGASGNIVRRNLTLLLERN